MSVRVCIWETCAATVRGLPFFHTTAKSAYNRALVCSNYCTERNENVADYANVVRLRRRTSLAAYSTETIAPKYHQALVDWQRKNFPELDFLLRNWTKYYPTQTPYQLFAKIGKLNSETLHSRSISRHPPI